MNFPLEYMMMETYPMDSHAHMAMAFTPAAHPPLPLPPPNPGPPPPPNPHPPPQAAVFTPPADIAPPPPTTADIPTPPSSPRKRRAPKAKRASKVMKRGPPTKHSNTASKFPIEEDNARLLQMKDCGAGWKEISEAFKEEGRGDLTTNVIRVRFYRLKDKMAVWEADDVAILQRAIAEVEKKKWELVSAKMVELGQGKIKRFSPAACEKKARTLN